MKLVDVFRFIGLLLCMALLDTLGHQLFGWTINRSGNLVFAAFATTIWAIREGQENA